MGSLQPRLLGQRHTITPGRAEGPRPRLGSNSVPPACRGTPSQPPGHGARGTPSFQSERAGKGCGRAGESPIGRHMSHGVRPHAKHSRRRNRPAFSTKIQQLGQVFLTFEGSWDPLRESDESHAEMCLWTETLEMTLSTPAPFQRCTVDQVKNSGSQILETAPNPQL